MSSISTSSLPLNDIDVKLHVGQSNPTHTQIPTVSTSKLSLDDIETGLEELIVKNKADTETIINWIDSNLDETMKKQPKFIRALMTTVCTCAIKVKFNFCSEVIAMQSLPLRNTLDTLMYNVNLSKICRSLQC